MSNPFESPGEDSLRPNSASELHERYGQKGVDASDFARIGFMMQIIGGFILLLGFVVCLASLLLGGLIVLVGACFFVPGRGLMNYRQWAWYAAVLVALPLSIVPSLVAVAAIFAGGAFWYWLAFPVMFGWVAYVLLSNSGRDRYRVLCESMAKRQARGKHSPAYTDLESSSPPEAPSSPREDLFA